MPAQIALNRPAFLREETTSIAPNGQASIQLYSQCNVIVQRKYAHVRGLSLNRADIRARCIFTLMAGYSRVHVWSLMTRIREINSSGDNARNPDSPDATLRKPLHRYGNHTFRRIRNNKPVHDHSFALKSRVPESASLLL